ncbi:MAG: hypothetical protein QXH81_03320 [Thermofilaceae archaeon]
MGAGGVDAWIPVFEERSFKLRRVAELLPQVSPDYVVEPGYIVYQRGGVVYAKNGLTGEIEFSGADASQVIQKAIDALGEDGGRVHIKAGTYNLASAITVKPGVWLTGEGTATTLHTESDTTLIHVTPGGEHVVTGVEGLRLLHACADPTQPAMVVSGWMDDDWTLATSVVVRDIAIVRPGAFNQRGTGLELRLSRTMEIVTRSLFENLRIRGFKTGLAFNFQDMDSDVWSNVFSRIFFVDNECDLKTLGETDLARGVSGNWFLFNHFCGQNLYEYCAVDFTAPVSVWENTFFGCFFDTSFPEIVKLGSRCEYNVFIAPRGQKSFVFNGVGNTILASCFPEELEDRYAAENSTTSTSYTEAGATLWSSSTYGPARIIVEGVFELRSSSSAATAYARIAIYDVSTSPWTLLASTEVSTTSTTYQRFRRVLAVDVGTVSPYIPIEFRISNSAYRAFIRNQVLKAKLL